MENKKVPIFMCATLYEWHIPGDYHGIKVYFDEKSLRENCSCVNHGCGIVQTELNLEEVKYLQNEDLDIKKENLIGEKQAIWRDIKAAFFRIRKHLRTILRGIYALIRLWMFDRFGIKFNRFAHRKRKTK